MATGAGPGGAQRGGATRAPPAESFAAHRHFTSFGRGDDCESYLRTKPQWETLVRRSVHYLTRSHGYPHTVACVMCHAARHVECVCVCVCVCVHILHALSPAARCPGYICVYIHIYTSLSLYIYIYIERERDMYTYVDTRTYISTPRGLRHHRLEHQARAPGPEPRGPFPHRRGRPPPSAGGGTCNYVVRSLFARARSMQTPD